MQFYQILAIVGLTSAGALAAPTAEADNLLGLSIPILSGDKSKVSCKSGNVYCSDGSKKTCTLSKQPFRCSPALNLH